MSLDSMMSSVASAAGQFAAWLSDSNALTAVASLLAVIIALAALRAERVFRDRDDLLQMLTYFDDKGFFVRMWRMEQATRIQGPGSVAPIDVGALKQHQKPVIATLAKEVLASDWEVDRADMYSAYFFSLRVSAWLTSPGGMRRAKRLRLLNSTFGHQLYETFLNHRLVSCRLRHPKVPANYYATYYGVFDARYTRLVDWLGADLLKRGGLQPIIATGLKTKKAGLDAYLSTATSLASAATPPVSPDPMEAGDASNNGIQTDNASRCR